MVAPIRDALYNREKSRCSFLCFSFEHSVIVFSEHKAISRDIYTFGCKLYFVIFIDKNNEEKTRRSDK